MEKFTKFYKVSEVYMCHDTSEGAPFVLIAGEGEALWNGMC